MVERNVDRSKLTFSQAEGIDPIPSPLALQELPIEVRNLLWSYIYESVKNETKSDMWDNLLVVGSWRGILYDFHVNFLYKAADEFSNAFADQTREIKKLFQEAPYNRVLDFIEFVLRHDAAPHKFLDVIQSILKKHQCAYMVVNEGPSIIPIAIPEQRESIGRSFKVLASGPFDGARTHLLESAQYINAGDYAGSVRESIHAVESVARKLSQDAKSSLVPALEALSEKDVVLHGAFKKGIEKLYGYSSDENGIRHSLLDEDEANVDMEDAAFMFGACASFAAYLVNKARSAGLITE